MRWQQIFAQVVFCLITAAEDGTAAVVDAVGDEGTAAADEW